MSAQALMIGGGNMGEAIVLGAIESGLTPPEAWVVADPNEERRAVFASRGVRAAPDALEGLASVDEEGQVWCAVKPQVFASLGETIAGRASGRVVVSIMAGITTDTIGSALGTERCVRVMPNTPVRIGMGVSACALGSGAAVEDASFARSIFAAMGVVVDLDEELMDAFTGLAGSGPAYVFRVAEALIEGGRRVGFSEEEARLIVPALLRGSAAWLSRSGAAPGALREAVTSPGGTTAAGLRVLDDRGVLDAIASGVVAARDRGRALGEGT